MKKSLLFIALAVALTGCAFKDKAKKVKIDSDTIAAQNWSNDQLYNEARSELNAKNYDRANKLYEILRARQAPGRYTEQSLLDAAYAHYKNEEPAKALALLSRFEHNYPASIDMDYALYLRGLVLFDEDQSFLRKLASQDWSDRDPQANRRAYRVFNELVTRYPDSKYAEDARKRMAQLVDALGGHQIAIAKYYAKRALWKRHWPSWRTPTAKWATSNPPTTPNACCSKTSRKAPICNKNGSPTICLGGVIGSNPLPDAIGSLKQKQLGAMPDCFVVR